MGDDLLDFFDLSHTQFGMLFTVVSPGCLALLGTGYLNDHFGIRFTGMAFGTVLALGHFIANLAPEGDSGYPWLLVGRTIYGVGASGVTSVPYTLVGIWFSEKKLNFAFGFLQVVL